MEKLPEFKSHNGRKVISARELHGYLESKQDFSHWIKARINKYGLIENTDYVVFDNFVVNPNGGRPSIEYALTLNCAKELSMVEANEKGKQARLHFIACEEELREMVESKLQLATASAKQRQIISNRIKEIDGIVNRSLKERSILVRQQNVMDRTDYTQLVLGFDDFNFLT